MKYSQINMNCDTKRILTVLTTTCLAFGCSKEAQREIAGDVLISAQIEDRQVSLYCETECRYECSNYSMITRDWRIGQTIHVQFRYVEEAISCFYALGPAAAIIDLGKLEHGGYDLKFNLNGSTVKGKLIVSEEAELEIIQNGNVKEAQ